MAEFNSTQEAFSNVQESATGLGDQIGAWGTYGLYGLLGYVVFNAIVGLGKKAGRVTQNVSKRLAA